MKKVLAILFLLGGLVLWPYTAQAHCDAVDGPVATAALKALDTKNANLILPFAPAEAEAELTAAFQQALAVRTKGPEAKALADRYFMETAVRLHRAGEKAAYTGLKPAGTDFGPAIPTAEKALESGALEPLLKLMTEELRHGIAERFEHARAKKAVTKEPEAKAGVRAARERMSAELEFIGYVDGSISPPRAGATPSNYVSAVPSTSPGWAKLPIPGLGFTFQTSGRPTAGRSAVGNHHRSFYSKRENIVRRS